MELNDRKKKILRAVVDSYIQSAEPVGSKAVAAMPDVGFSSATIRNEMAELETMGYLEQPHTSAGRIPTPAGYRLYVDELMLDYRLSIDETRSLNDALHVKISELDQVLSEAGKAVARLTNYPAYALTSRSGRITIKRFDLIQTDAHTFIAVILTNTEMVRNKLIRLPIECGAEDLRLLSSVLNVTFTDLTAEEMTPELLRKAERSTGAASGLVPVVLGFAFDVLSELSHGNLYVTGQTGLLMHPEYRDVGKARQLMDSIGDEEVLANIPAPESREDVKILIGPENVTEALKETSVIVASYNIGDGMQGMIGVVGPTRMEYNKVAAKLSYLADGLGKIFKKELMPHETNDTEDN